MNNIFLVQSCLNPDLKRGPLLQKGISVSNNLQDLGVGNFFM